MRRIARDQSVMSSIPMGYKSHPCTKGADCPDVHRINGTSMMCVILMAAMSCLIFRGSASGHTFIWSEQRTGAAPCAPGTGWFVEVFWGIPDEDSTDLFAAEFYVMGREPTFTFHADYIDWPAGPDSFDRDENFATMGDFLNDYISDISDPDALDLPFGNFLLRAHGNVNIRLEDSSFYTEDPPPPVFYDIGLVSSDGGRVFIDPTTIFRMVLPEPPNGFMSDDAVADVPGLYPLQVTYFQHFDPDNEFNAELAGVELLSCHEDGLDLPSGELLRFRCKTRAGRGMPPWVIYSSEQAQQILDGDFEVDGDVDLADVARIQRCYTGPDFEGFLTQGCFIFDFDGDEDVDLSDYTHFAQQLTDPLQCQ